MKKLLTCLLILGGYATYAQDLIMLRTGDEIENVKVLDTLENVIYRKDGQGLSKSKADVLYIKYANGVKVKLSSNNKTKQPDLTSTKVEPPVKKVEPPTNPLIQNTPTMTEKKVEEPKENKSWASILEDIDKKFKTQGTKGDIISNSYKDCTPEMQQRKLVSSKNMIFFNQHGLNVVRYDWKYPDLNCQINLASYYYKKRKRNNTAGFIFLGLASAMCSASSYLGDSKAALIVPGALFFGGSIPFFVTAKKYRKKMTYSISEAGKLFVDYKYQ